MGVGRGCKLTCLSTQWDFQDHDQLTTSFTTSKLTVSADDILVSCQTPEVVQEIHNKLTEWRLYIKMWPLNSRSFTVCPDTH